MGKRLIIKGANFASVAVDKEVITRWLFDDIDWGSPSSNNTNPVAKSLYGCALANWNYNAVAGKKIIGIKANVKNVCQGTFEFGVFRNMKNVGEVGGKVSCSMDSVELQRLQVSSTGVQTIMLNTPVVLTENDWCGIGNISIDATGQSMLIPVFWHYPLGPICYVDGPQDPAPNHIDDKSGAQNYRDYPHIALLYEV